jgi:hypothetical protein
MGTLTWVRGYYPTTACTMGVVHSFFMDLYPVLDRFSLSTSYGQKDDQLWLDFAGALDLDEQALSELREGKPSRKQSPRTTLIVHNTGSNIRLDPQV